MKGILILFFWYLIILLFIIMCVILGHSQNFPVADIGDCYRGVDVLDDYYKNSSVLYAYNPYPIPGHCWLIVDGVPIDSYYGEINNYQYRNPMYVYDSYKNMTEGIKRITGRAIL